MRYSWPLTGRVEEMRVIEAAIADPAVAGIVIGGSAGVGKSRIAREALLVAASNGCETRWAVSTSSARGIPLGALEPWAPTTGTETLQVVRSVVKALTSAPESRPVVIGIDDVNLLDDLSTFALHRIVSGRAAKLVCTVRDRDPVAAATRELWAAAPFDRLDLQPLSRDDTAQLLSATLGGRVDSTDATRLWRLTRGNALYLRNIVEQEVTDGRLTQQHGCWRWNGEPALPAGLVDMIESRIGVLPAAVGDVLDSLAVGEPIELAGLTRITDAAAVEEADTRGLISIERVAGRSEVRVAHPLYAEVRRNRAAPTRLRRMRGLVATELANCDAAGDTRTLVRRATLSIDSDLPPDPELLVKAAQDSVWLADLALAGRLADAAIRAGAGLEAYFVRAVALSWLGRTQEADAVLVGCPTDGFSAADRARLAFLRASNVFWLADPALGKKLIDDAARTTPSSARGCIDAFLTQYWAVTGKPAAARRIAKTLTLNQLPGIAAAVTAASTTLACGDAGRIAEAAVAAGAGYDITERAHDAAHMRFGIADVHVGALLLAGRIAEAHAAAQQLCQRAADLPGPSARLQSATVAGRAALGAGRLDAACFLLEPAVESLGTSGDRHWEYLARLFHSIALAMCGSTEAAAAALCALEVHPSWRCLDYALALARAWVAVGRGSLREAIQHSRSAAENAYANGQFAAEVMCLQTAAQFGDHSCAPRLRELATLVEGPRVVAAARFADALAAGDAAELESVSLEFERMGDRVAAVDVAAHAVAAYRRQGRRGSAYACAGRAEALAQQCGGLQTPALVDAIEPLPLTAREREIAMMLADGLANRAIAQRLSLSVRTVEAHIYRAMAKTGAADRVELAALLPGHRRAGMQ